jgi:hypothetical protein
MALYISTLVSHNDRAGFIDEPKHPRLEERLVWPFHWMYYFLCLCLYFHLLYRCLLRCPRKTPCFLCLHHTIPPTIILTTKNTHNSTYNHYKLLNTPSFPRTITIDQCTLQQFHRKSIWTTTHAHNSTDNKHKPIGMHKNPPIIIIDCWTLPRFDRQSQWTTQHAHNTPDNQSILLSTHTIHRHLLKITEHYRNSTNNHYKLLNSHTAPLTITINYWKLP